VNDHNDEDQKRLLQLFAQCRDNPVLFAERILGVRLWSKQRDIVNAIARHDRVAVKSGHKVGKTRLCAIVALWFASMRPSGRVIMTSSSARQVRNILWREVKQLHNASVLLKQLGGVCHDDPNSGLKFPNGAEVLGFSTDEPEKMAGLSGEYMLFIVDEASGVPEEIFEAIEGNRAGGAKLVMISNPTRTSGTFYNAFRDPVVKGLWKTFSISSEASPNVTGEVRIPGLATKEWIDEKRIEWGPDYLKSPLYLVRVMGEFPSSGDRNIVSVTLAETAMARDRSNMQGPLSCGLDPSGEGSDESVLCIRRGTHAVRFATWKKLDSFQLTERVISTITEMRQGDEHVTLNVDSIGIGAGVYQALRRFAPSWLNVQGVKSSYASNRPNQFALLRDELWWNLGQWLKDGGTLPRDPKLETELVAVEFDLDGKGRIKVESKKELKKRIGRSPDRADALALAIYSSGVTLAEWKQTATKIRESLRRREKRTV